ncbi:hypothetical protein LCGC14_1157930 [marine sediment metagenome]|uniref:Uncharacterized protein n=1 Tax=marine sediment metagenome TaxID=412755 RepID=A0A0F9PZ22_9ZZZZ
MATESKSLRTGNYVIELSDGPSVVHKIHAKSGHKDWVCTCPDPEAAMVVVEGLILVENKRFYYPGSKPTMKFDEKQAEKTHPNFLNRKSD